MNWSICEADSTDAAGLAPLLSELGYPSTVEQMFARLGRIAGDPTYGVWLARLPDSSPIGMAAGHLMLPIEQDGLVAQLTALVSTESMRGRGVGASLVQRFEGWALSQGAQRVIVTSGASRIKAHAFYERLGYTETGKRFGISLRPLAR